MALKALGVPAVLCLKVAVEDRRDTAQEGASLLGDQDTIAGALHQTVAFERCEAFQFGFEDRSTDAPLGAEALQVHVEVAHDPFDDGAPQPVIVIDPDAPHDRQAALANGGGIAADGHLVLHVALR